MGTTGTRGSRETRETASPMHSLLQLIPVACRVSRVAFDSRLSTPELTSPAARGVTKYTSLTSPWSARTTSKATEAAKSLIYMLEAYGKIRIGESKKNGLVARVHLTISQPVALIWKKHKIPSTSAPNPLLFFLTFTLSNLDDPARALLEIRTNPQVKPQTNKPLKSPQLKQASTGITQILKFSLPNNPNISSLPNNPNIPGQEPRGKPLKTTTNKPTTNKPAISKEISWRDTRLEHSSRKVTQDHQTNQTFWTRLSARTSKHSPQPTPTATWTVTYKLRVQRCLTTALLPYSPGENP